jgi:hypothetical protein
MVGQATLGTLLSARVGHAVLFIQNENLGVEQPPHEVLDFFFVQGSGEEGLNLIDQGFSRARPVGPIAEFPEDELHALAPGHKKGNLGKGSSAGGVDLAILQVTQERVVSRITGDDVKVAPRVSLGTPPDLICEDEIESVLPLNRCFDKFNPIRMVLDKADDRQRNGLLVRPEKDREMGGLPIDTIEFLFFDILAVDEDIIVPKHICFSNNGVLSSIMQTKGRKSDRRGPITHNALGVAIPGP